EEPDVHARRVQPLVAERARAVRERKRYDNDVAAFYRADLGADVLDDADRLVAHRLAGITGLHRRVRPQIAATDASSGHSDHGIGRLNQVGVRDGLDTNIAGTMHDGCAHLEF